MDDVDDNPAQIFFLLNTLPLCLILTVHKAIEPFSSTHYSRSNSNSNKQILTIKWINSDTLSHC